QERLFIVMIARIAVAVCRAVLRLLFVCLLEPLLFLASSLPPSAQLHSRCHDPASDKEATGNKYDHRPPFPLKHGKSDEKD
ncbi:MAG TPA: hypothetical protein VGZ47_08970, partial [Gemmataceae bacterium]|nr:hypothetical protein [Gemmataceae bacterium]